MKACILAYFCVVIVAFEGMWWWLLNNIGLVLHNQALGTPHFIIVPMTTGYNIACALHPSLVSIPFYAIPISLSIIHRIFYLLVYSKNYSAGFDAQTEVYLSFLSSFTCVSTAGFDAQMEVYLSFLSFFTCVSSADTGEEGKKGKINFRLGIEPGTQRLGVQYTKHQAITLAKSANLTLGSLPV